MSTPYNHNFIPPTHASLHNPLWTAVEAYTTKHLLSSPLPNITISSSEKDEDPLTHALRTSHASSLPPISCYPSQGKYLSLQARLLNVTHVLEIGTLGGYSSIWLASASSHLKIVSVEIDPHHAAVARANVAYAGLSERVEIIVGDAGDVLPVLKGEVERGERERFGMAFFDADEFGYVGYLEEFLGMCIGRGGVVYVDNVVWHGELAPPTEKEEGEGEGGRMGAVRRFVEHVGRDERVEGVIIQTVGDKGYDGFLMVVVN